MQFYTIDQLLNKVLGGGAINVTHNPSAEQVLNMVYNPSYAALNVNILNYAGGGGSVDLSGYYTKTETDNIAATKLAVADVVDSLTSTETAKPLSAAQGKALKTLIDNIIVLLGSDNVNLDTLQEIVDFIELNKATLDTLGISNIAGLQNALNAKADATHNHDGAYAAASHTHQLKTINGQSIEGSGNIDVSGSASVVNIVTGVEYLVPKTIDGKQVYGICVECGTLPNNTIKNVAIPYFQSSYKYWVNTSDSFAYAPTISAVIPIPYADPIASYYCGIDLDTLNGMICFRAYKNMSAYTTSRVSLHYTK